MPRKALKPVVPGAAPLVDPTAAAPLPAAPEPGDYDDAADPMPVTHIEGSSKASLGDSETYKHKHAHQVDATKIDRAVLTRDGWVLPLPKSQPE